MSPRRFLFGSVLIASCWLGCAHKPASPPAEKPAAAPAAAPAEAAAAPAPEKAAAPAAAPETPPPPPAPAPECTAATDCASKGTPQKGMQWACAEGKCAEQKKPAKKGKK